jgi:alpha-mannosidase
LQGEDVNDPVLWLPEMVRQFNEQPNAPFQLRFGVPADFEKATAARAELPVITGQRNPLFQGVYSTRIELKQLMRDTETLLVDTEKFGALAAWLGAPADPAAIWPAWEPALFNVTHDLASGVMTDEVYADTLRGYDFSRRLGQSLLEERIGGALTRIDTRGAGAPLVVFNTLGWTRTDAAEGEADFDEKGVRDFDLLDDAGKAVPAQIVETNCFQDGGLRQARFVFLARAIPAMGHVVYHVVPRYSAGPSKFGARGANDSGALENEFVRAQFDLSTGAIESLRAKADGWEALARPGNVVAVEPDHGDVWELYHNLDGTQQLIMTRPLPAPRTGEAHFSNERPGSPGTALRGPVFSQIEVSNLLGSNVFTTVARVYAGIDRVEFQTKILNRDEFARYRLLMPTTLTNGRNFQEIPFGAVQRPENQEFPAQKWMDYSDGAHGAALLNHALPGNNAADGTLMLSLMRSTRIQQYNIYGGFEGQGSDTALELGKELTFQYALVAHGGDWSHAAVYREGLEFNHPLIVRKASTHSGSLPQRWGFLSISPGNVVLSALKTAKDGSTVARVYEAGGRAVDDAAIQFNAKVLSARESNLMEDSGRALKVRHNAIRFGLRPFEIKTFKFRLKPNVSKISPTDS